MVKPQRTLLFFLIIFFLTGLLSLIWPSGGIALWADFRLKFPTRQDLFPAESQEANAKRQKVIGMINDYQKALADSTAIVEDESGEPALFNLDALRLQYKRTGVHPLESFFRKLSDIQEFDIPLRVMHFGDSQIEGDRMSGYIRQSLQKKFGGSGPGLLPIIEAVPSFAIAQTSEGQWTRFALFGGAKKNVGHTHFGVLQNFARFEPGGENGKTSLFYSPHQKSASGNRKYQSAQVFLGNVETPCIVEFFVGDSLWKRAELTPGTEFRSVRCKLDSVPESLEIRFTSEKSPDIYAVSLESNSGILVDNIGMRGSSGTDFTKMGKSHLEQVFSPFNVGLIILQYGGNTVPHITTEEGAKQYGRWFGAQIKVLKSVVPDCGIVVIGPSDMSTMIDGKMQSYPFLEKVRDAMKTETIEAGAAYWDLYEIMGGQNSMPEWVKSDPPLAASDHIHFTLQGARTTADLFITFLMQEFENQTKDAAQP